MQLGCQSVGVFGDRKVKFQKPKSANFLAKCIFPSPTQTKGGYPSLSHSLATHSSLATPTPTLASRLQAAGAIGFNYTTTMGIIFVNKVLFLHTAFPVLSLTAAHLGVSALFTRLALALGIFKVGREEGGHNMRGVASR